MIPEGWHYPVAYREVAPGPDGKPWIWRVGLNWTAYFPLGAKVAVRED